MVALERATLYGIVVYSNRRVELRQRRPGGGARDLHPRGAGRRASGRRKLPFLAANRKLIAQVEELEHKSRRQDVLVDDELIYAFYDQQMPADVRSGATLRALVPRRSRSASRDLLLLTRDELMRHEAAGITTAAFPKTHPPGRRRLRRRATCTSPATPKDGVTVTRADLSR